MDDTSYNIIINKFNEFFDVCKKKNNKFYLVINFTKNDNWKFSNLIYYSKFFADYLITNKDNLDNYLYGTILITVQKISFVWTLFTKYYKPLKPVKIITPDMSIDFSFIND
jgi:outer membrane receptor for monomeric catechols